MAGLPMLLSRIVLLDGCIVFYSYLLVVIGLENSRNDLTCCEVRNQKTDHADHCPTAIGLFCFLWIAGVVLYKLRLCFTAKDVLLAVLSDYLR